MTRALAIGLLIAIIGTLIYLKIVRDRKNAPPDQLVVERTENEKQTMSESYDSLHELNGYNELADVDDRPVYPVSEYNTDLSDVENILRPDHSEIISPTIDTAQLFRIWTLDPNGPHADFWIKKDFFYVVDYDGDGDMPYRLQKDSLVIYYNDFIQRGKILKVTKDTLSITWEGIGQPTHYVEWKN